jgi:hypothetical protein
MTEEELEREVRRQLTAIDREESKVEGEQAIQAD